MKTKLIQVISIPKNVVKNTVLEITSTDVGYFTHSFFKYPCKFIPQVPRWAIEKYTKENDLVLDCFAGSGTTLVESVLLNRNALGVDFDKLSQLLCITKTKILSDKEILEIRKNLNSIFKKSNQSNVTLPDLHNIEHWFSKEAINELCVLKINIDKKKGVKIKIINQSRNKKAHVKENIATLPTAKIYYKNEKSVYGIRTLDRIINIPMR